MGLVIYISLGKQHKKGKFESVQKIGHHASCLAGQSLVVVRPYTRGFVQTLSAAPRSGVAEFCFPKLEFVSNV